MLDLHNARTQWADLLEAELAGAAAIREGYAAKRAADAARERTLALSSIVQAQIIPRLMLLERNEPPIRRACLPKLGTDEVAAFTDLLLGDDVATVTHAFSALITQGYCPDDLFLDLLAPAAALLGRMWDDDLCDFVEVTAGLAQLQYLLATFRTDGAIVPFDRQRRILLMGLPDEQHTFGLAIVEQFLRKAGWHVDLGLASSAERIDALVRSQHFAVVGLTLSRETHLDHLTQCIRAVRRASANRSVSVMVGGPVFLEHPEYVARVGADASAVDAPTAVLLAQRLSSRTEAAAR